MATIKKRHTVILIIFLLIAISCNKDDIFGTLISENGFSYNQSLNQWNALKKTNGNSYVYKTTVVSWIGYRSTTELKIKNGVVISRNYRASKINHQTGEKEILETYSENFENLGSHKNGAIPQTIDELYKSCAKKYLIVDKKNNTLYFETKKNGLMTLCGFVSNGCADDCFRGIRIDSFKWTK